MVSCYLLRQRYQCFQLENYFDLLFIVLADGGGIKGLVLTRMLLSMERSWNTKIVDCFDWIAGTSTGGILALGLATGLNVIECQRLYFRLKDKVFIDSRPYASKPFEELLQETFGLKKMKDISSPKWVRFY